MISETSSLQRSGKVAGEVSKEIEAEMNAIKEVAVANNRTTDVAEPEDYDTDLEEESRPQNFTNFCYLPHSKGMVGKSFITQSFHEVSLITISNFTGRFQMITSGLF